MSDWVLEDNKDIPIKPSINPTGSDWEIERESIPSSESFLESAANAPIKIGEDIINTALNFVGKIPEYYEKAKTEIPGALQPIRQHPVHAAMQALAGSQELINQLAQTPKNLSEYGTNRLNLIPQSVTNFISKITPEDTSTAINQLFDQPKYPGEALIRGGIRNIPTIMGGGAIAKLPSKLSYKHIAKNVVNTEKNLLDKYSNLYDSLWEKADQRGLGDMRVVKPEIDFDTIKKYSPKKDYEGVEDFINNPTLNNAHYAKSDLLAIKRKLEKNPTHRTAERKQFKAISEAIDNIQQNMFKTKEGTIHPDLLNEYNQIQMGYAKNVIPYNKNKNIQAYKRNELTDKELIDRLSRGKFAAQKGKEHPAMRRRKIINNLLPSLGIGGGLLFGYKTIKDFLSGK